MQADTNISIAENRVLVRPDIANLLIAETKSLVEAERVENIRRVNTEFQKMPECAHREAPMDLARCRLFSMSLAASETFQSGDASGHPPMHFSMVRLRNDT